MSKGIQNNRVRTVDVIYTQLGRKYKASSNPSERAKAEIVKFSLSDDGVDYNLYNSNLADAEKNKNILNTPQFSAWTNENSLMRNRLKTEPRDVGEVYEMYVDPATVSWDINTLLTTSIQQKKEFVAVNFNFPPTSGFSVTIEDIKYFIQDVAKDKYSAEERRSGEPISHTEIYFPNGGETSFSIGVLYDASISRLSTTDANTGYETQMTVQSLGEGFKKTIKLIIE